MTKKFHGRQRNIQQVMRKLGGISSQINVFGAYAIGKTRFIEHIHELMGQNALTAEHRVIRINGRIFPRRAKNRNVPAPSFLEFLAYHLKNEFGQKDWIAGEESLAFEIQQNLKRAVEKGKGSVVIIIDDFTRILENMNIVEVRGLNEIYPPGVHYVLVTDERRIDEIRPKLTSGSDFFRDFEYVGLQPLYHNEVESLLADINESFPPDEPLTREDMELVEGIAGGHPGLLIEVANRLHRERYAQYEEGLKEKALERYSKTWHLVVRRIVDYEPIQTQLNHIYESLTSAKYAPRRELIEYLLLLASGQTEIMPDKERQDWTARIKPIDEARLLEKGLLAPDQRRFPYAIASELVRYIILTRIGPPSLTGAQKVLFDLFLSRIGNIVSTDEIEAHFAGQKSLSSAEVESESAQGRGKAESVVPKMKRSYIDTTLNRLKSDLAESPNRHAFVIENVRGQGYRMENLLRLDLLMRFGAQALCRATDNEVKVWLLETISE